MSLFQSASNGNMDAITKAFENDESIIHSTDENGNTLLHWACLKGQTSVIYFLLGHGSRIDCINSRDETPVHWACINGNVKHFHELVCDQLDVIHIKEQSGFNALHMATQYGNLHIVYYILMHLEALGLDVDERDSRGNTALHWSAYKGQDEIARLLLSCGAEVDSRENNKLTPLHWAVIKDQINVVKLLVGEGASLKKKTEKKKTAITIAEEKGFSAIHKHLVRCTHMVETRELRGKWYEYFWFAFAFAIVFGFCFVLQFFPIWVLPIFIYAIYFSVKRKIRDYWPGMEVKNTFLIGWFIASYAISTLWYFAQVLPLVMDYTTETVLFILLNCILATVYLALVFGNPGVLHPDPETDIKKFIKEIEDTAKPKLCTTCKIIRPIRSKHDRKQDVCVERFDHYCFWINNSVGKNNHKLFFVLLFLIVCLHVSFTRFCYLALMRLTENFNMISFFQAAPTMTFLFCLHIFHGTWEGWLLYQQAKNVVENITINELSNWNKYPEWQDANGKFYNPYARDAISNIKEFFSGAVHQHHIEV